MNPKVHQILMWCRKKTNIAFRSSRQRQVRGAECMHRHCTTMHPSDTEKSTLPPNSTPSFTLPHTCAAYESKRASHTFTGTEHLRHVHRIPFLYKRAATDAFKTQIFHIFTTFNWMPHVPLLRLVSTPHVLVPHTDTMTTTHQVVLTIGHLYVTESNAKFKGTCVRVDQLTVHAGRWDEH